MFKSIILAVVLVFVTNINLQAQSPLNTKEIYIFTTQQCHYCELLKRHILTDSSVIESLNNVTVRMVDSSKVNRNILNQWKIKGVPTIVGVDRVNDKQLIILEYWQLNYVNTDTRNLTNNKASFVKFIKKYSQKP